MLVAVGSRVLKPSIYAVALWLLFAGGATIATVTPVVAADKIEWRLVNPFRLFLDADDTDLHRKAFESLDEGARRTPIASVERMLGQAYPRGWAEDVYDAICWDVTTARYTCNEYKDFVHPASHRIVARVPGGAADKTCQWEVVAAQAGPRAGGKKAAAAPQRNSVGCAEQVSLDIPYPAGAEVTVSVDGQRLAAQHIKVADLFIVGIGDSFGSGEGNPDKPVRLSGTRSADYAPDRKDGRLAGYPVRDGDWRTINDIGFWKSAAQWTSRNCRRSLYSHQLRTALQLAVENPQRSVTFVGLACSGAQITEGLFLRYKGTEWIGSPPRLSQISAAAEAQCGSRPTALQEYASAYTMSDQLLELQNVALTRCPREVARKIDLLLVSIGGNDIGFSRLVANAILRDEGTLRRLGGWLGQVQTVAQTRARLDVLDLRYKALRRAIHNILHVPWEEPDRVILNSYPYLARLADGRSPCPDRSGGMSVIPAFELDGDRTADAESLADQLAERMRRYADVNGFSFVNAHRSVFAGRGLCTGNDSGDVVTADDLRMPIMKDGQWIPFNPSTYQPYRPRNRWVLTPTDAFLAVNFHAQAPGPARLRQKLDQLQLILAGTYSGAFHPSAEGQAVMADAVTEKARSVLKRYGQ